MKRNLGLGSVLFAVLAGVGVCGALKTSAAAEAATSPDRASDEQELRQSADDFVRAYEDRDAQAVAGLFTEGAEIVEADGTVTQGRDQIEQLFAADFAAEAAEQMKIEIDSIRFLSTNTALEEGRMLVGGGDAEEPVISIRYTALHVREGDKWLVARSHNFASEEIASPHEHLKQLDWLLGDWVDEGAGSLVTASCRWDEGGNFLLRDYAIHHAGNVVMTGTHRIGWDPLEKRLTSWTFDSEGGHSVGYWYHHGDEWILKLSGFSADGKVGTAMHIYKPVSKHVTKWKAVERTLDGEPLDDIAELTIVRASKHPDQRTSSETQDSK